MRVLLLADVHANWEALAALQRAEPAPDALLFAGDAVGYGTEPAACVRWLAAHATAAVRGNHDEAAITGSLHGAPPELAEAAAESIAVTRRQLAPHDVQALQNWPLTAQIELGSARFWLTHGTPAAPLTGELTAALSRAADLHALFDAIPADVILLGHTHQPALRTFGDKLIINPGSLGQPRYGVPDATYAIWEGGRVQIKHLHYAHDTAAQRLALWPLSPEAKEQLADVLQTGLIENA